MKKNIFIKIGLIFTLTTIIVGANIVTGLNEIYSKEDIRILISMIDAPVYSTIPNWISDDPHYSTGAALADFNRDGWLDLVIADGNDISPGRLNIYLNNGKGTFPKTASWQSEDLAYNGHLDVADVNGDGWSDVAVSYLGKSDDIGPIARVYLNNEGVLSNLPDWTSDIIGNAFSVDFGDMNNDGRPDLAVATGWSYRPQHSYHNYVYLNIDGILESSASWESDDTYNYQGIHWVDADNDGWLDLVGIGTGQEIQIYHNTRGILKTSASWQTSDSYNQDGIMLTTGDIDYDGILDLFATDNTQLGGSGFFKQYNGLKEGFFETTYSWNFYGGYGSAIALADVNGDEKLDLATGAWWGNTWIFYNDGSGYTNNPSWNSEYTSVVEKIVFGDIGPSLHNENIISEYFFQVNRRLFYLPYQPIQDIKNVYCDDIILNTSEYTFSREHGWITIGITPTDSVEIIYTYSPSMDMIVSNWDENVGNFLYYNKLFDVDLDCTGSLSFTDIKPGQTVRGNFSVINIGEPMSKMDWKIESYPEWGTWLFNPESGDDLTPEDGTVTVQVTVIAPEKTNENFSGDIKIVNRNNNYDFDNINVTISTLKNKSFINPLYQIIEKVTELFSNLERLLPLQI